MSLCLRARLLTEAGFRHGFSLRTGGVSGPPFSDLNLARNLGDDPAAVEENHRRLASAVGYSAECLFEASQVHGVGLAVADEKVPSELFRSREADALLALEPGQAVGIRVADCVPVLMADPGSGAVLAIHAGWRGVVAGVVPEAVARMLRETGAQPGALLAAIGPHIGPEAFEIGDEVAQALVAAIPEDPRVVIACEPPAARRPRADLGRAVRAQLVRMGLWTERVESVGGCTYTNAKQFFSYRRDGAASGRHLAVIVAGC